MINKGVWKKSRKKKLKAVNEARKFAGLSKIKVKKRECLKCGKKFESQGNWNRMCDVCRGKTMWNYEINGYFA